MTILKEKNWHTNFKFMNVFLLHKFPNVYLLKHPKSVLNIKYLYKYLDIFMYKKVKYCIMFITDQIQWWFWHKKQRQSHQKVTFKYVKIITK